MLIMFVHNCIDTYTYGYKIYIVYRGKELNRHSNYMMIFFLGCYVSTDSVYVDLQYDEISLTFTAVTVFLCCLCSHVVVFGLCVRLPW